MDHYPHSDSDRPRPLTARQLALLSAYRDCELGLSPRIFYAKWNVTHEQMAEICDRSPYTVRRWFARGDRYRRPTPSDLRHLALVDLLWERWDDLPDDLKRRLRCTDG